MSLTLKENTILNFVYYIRIVEIPTNKGANPYKLNISRMGKSPSEIYTRLHIYIQITCYCVYVTLAFDTGFESDHTIFNDFLVYVISLKWWLICGLNVSLIRITFSILPDTIHGYPCDICGRSFRQKGNLNQHMDIHTDKRKFQCCMCNKTFNRKNTLKRHMLIHMNQNLSDDIPTSNLFEWT